MKMWNDRATLAHKDDSRSVGCVPMVQLLEEPLPSIEPELVGYAQERAAAATLEALTADDVLHGARAQRSKLSQIYVALDSSIRVIERELGSLNEMRALAGRVLDSAVDRAARNEAAKLVGLSYGGTD
jgi:hypothetical protein